MKDLDNVMTLFLVGIMIFVIAINIPALMR